MNDYFAIALSVFIVYRLALIITTEDGPFEMFRWWRESTIKAWGVNHWITRGFYCPLCVGFWLSFLVVVFIPDIGLLKWITYSLAVAGAQTLLTLIGGIPDE